MTRLCFMTFACTYRSWCMCMQCIYKLYCFHSHSISAHSKIITYRHTMGICKLTVLSRPLVVFALFFSCVRSAPVTNEVRLLSQNSGRFVQVLENGTITANARLKFATVFNMFLKNSLVEFEMMSKPGMFLLLKEITTPTNITASSSINATHNSYSHDIIYALRVDLLSTSNLTGWQLSGEVCGALSQDVDNDTICNIAFDEAGNVIGPCRVRDSDCIAVL